MGSMVNLSEVSCKELQQEIINRRAQREKEIRQIYSDKERIIVDKYKKLIEIVKLDKDIENCIKSGCLTKSDFFNQDRIEETLSYIICSNVVTVQEIPTRMTPQIILERIRDSNLVALHNAMKNEITKLY